MTNELHIPDSAYLVAQFYPDGELAGRARTFAAIVTAAELRRLADGEGNNAPNRFTLLRRADQLDGGA